MAINEIRRQADERYLDTVARALMGTADVRQTGSDYHRLDYSEVLTVAATENTPLSVRLARREAARDIKHFWLEQYLPDAGVVTPLAEVADPSLNGAHVPLRYENVMMRLGRKFQISDELDIIARAGGLIAVGSDEFARQMNMQLTLMIRDQEKAILEAQYDDGGTGNPRQMKGLLGGYKLATPVENGWISANSATTTDAGGVEITKDNIDSILNQALRKIALLYQGPLPTSLYVPASVLRPLSLATQNRLQVQVPWSELNSAPQMTIGAAIGKWYSNFGVLNIYFHPLLDAATSATPGAGETTLMQSRMLMLNEGAINLVDYVGHAGIHVDNRPKNDASETRVITQYMSLEMRYINSHGQVRNFFVDPTK